MALILIGYILGVGSALLAVALWAALRMAGAQ